jgi:hypothetical protein
MIMSKLTAIVVVLIGVMSISSAAVAEDATKGATSIKTIPVPPASGVGSVQSKTTQSSPAGKEDKAGLKEVQPENPKQKVDD